MSGSKAVNASRKDIQTDFGCMYFDYHPADFLAIMEAIPDAAVLDYVPSF